MSMNQIGYVNCLVMDSAMNRLARILLEMELVDYVSLISLL